MTTLPAVPAQLIRLALDCVQAVRVDRRYVLDMDYRHQPFDRQGDPGVNAGFHHCRVSFAGTVIAQELGYAAEQAYPPFSASGDPTFEQRQLLALDAIAEGELLLGLRHLQLLDLDNDGGLTNTPRNIALHEAGLAPPQGSSPSGYLCPVTHMSWSVDRFLGDMAEVAERLAPIYVPIVDDKSNLQYRSRTEIDAPHRSPMN